MNYYILINPLIFITLVYFLGCLMGIITFFIAIKLKNTAIYYIWGLEIMQLTDFAFTFETYKARANILCKYNLVS